jgi:hypothetical protein
LRGARRRSAMFGIIVALVVSAALEARDRQALQGIWEVVAVGTEASPQKPPRLRFSFVGDQVLVKSGDRQRRRAEKVTTVWTVKRFNLRLGVRYPYEDLNIPIPASGVLLHEPVRAPSKTMAIPIPSPDDWHVLPAVYHLQGDTLLLYIAFEGRPRPAWFADEPDIGQNYLVLKRRAVAPAVATHSR